MLIEFLIARTENDGTKCGGRILLGDNTGVARSCCGRSGSIVLEVGFQLDCLVCTRTETSDLSKMWLAPYLLERNNCLLRAVLLHFYLRLM